MKGSGKENQTLAICFGQFGPYHHARVAALQRLVWEMGDGSSAENRKLNTGDCSHAWRVLPVQIAAATSTYAWSGLPSSEGLRVGEDQATSAVASPPRAAGLRTLCEGTDEAASPLGVFLKARKLFRAESVGVAFLPSYSPARFFALFAAAKSLGIRTVMMNESHAGTEQANGFKRWIKRQIVRRFDAAFVGGAPHKRHFASLGIPPYKIFTGYDAVDGEFFAQRADEIRAAQKRSQDSGDRGQSEGGEDSVSVFQNLPTGCLAKPQLGFSNFRKTYGLPQRYFLSLGRMVEKKNLATLVAAYAKFCDGWRVASDESARRAPASLVFVGSGELEGALREQARSHGMRVIDRTDWKSGQSSHGSTRIYAAESARQPEANGSERLAADRTKGNAASSVIAYGSSTASGPPVRAGCGLSPETTSGEDVAAMKTRNSLPAIRDDENCGTVFFYGFRQIQENPVFYALAEAFVLPSLKEEWGLVVNEAMACSLPVIVSRTAGCAEDLLPGSEQVTSDGCRVTSKDAEDRELSTDDSLEERSNGFVFDPKSCDELATALARVAEMGDRRSEMGKRSREIVAKFSCENFARQALRAAEAAGA